MDFNYGNAYQSISSGIINDQEVIVETFNLYGNPSDDPGILGNEHQIGTSVNIRDAETLELVNSFYLESEKQGKILREIHDRAKYLKKL